MGKTDRIIAKTNIVYDDGTLSGTMICEYNLRGKLIRLTCEDNFSSNTTLDMSKLEALARRHGISLNHIRYYR